MSRSKKARNCPDADDAFIFREHKHDAPKCIKHHQTNCTEASGPPLGVAPRQSEVVVCARVALDTTDRESQEGDLRHDGRALSQSSRAGMPTSKENADREPSAKFKDRAQRLLIVMDCESQLQSRAKMLTCNAASSSSLTARSESMARASSFSGPLAQKIRYWPSLIIIYKSFASGAQVVRPPLPPSPRTCHHARAELVRTGHACAGSFTGSERVLFFLAVAMFCCATAMPSPASSCQSAASPQRYYTSGPGGCA